MAMEELKDYLAGIRKEYMSQAEALRDTLLHIPSDRLHSPIKAGDWSPHKVLMHVVATAEQALGPRVIRILTEDEPYLPDWDHDRWMDENYDPDIPSHELLADFEQLQDQIAKRLSGITLDDWNRTGRHPLRGVRTLLWWFEYLVSHNKEHIQQLREAAE